MFEEFEHLNIQLPTCTNYQDLFWLGFAPHIITSNPIAEGVKEDHNIKARFIAMMGTELEFDQRNLF